MGGEGGGGGLHRQPEFGTCLLWVATWEFGWGVYHLIESVGHMYPGTHRVTAKVDISCGWLCK